MEIKDGPGLTVCENIKVFCRLRPPLPSDNDTEDNYEDDFDEGGKNSSAFVTPEMDLSRDLDILGCIEGYDEEGGIRYRKNSGESVHPFKFTGCFGPDATQEQVYVKAALPVVNKVLKGYNGTIFAYGQTGSGKTHTMRGQGINRNGGIIPRAVSQIFETSLQREQNVSIEITVSYLQIYCEMLMDLLNPQSENLLIRERKGEIYVEGVAEVAVHSVQECMQILQRGDDNRVTASTKLNATSSRSHAALLINVTQRSRETNNNLLKSTLVMVDLAGSERAKVSGALNRPSQFQELKAINLSLSALGNCVSALAQGRTHIPYRDSKLTRLLQQSLGGNACTSLIVTIRPGTDETGETSSSLQFAQRALQVKVEAIINKQVDYEELCKNLQQQLDQKDDEIHQLQLGKVKMETQLGGLNTSLETAQLEALRAKAGLKAAEEGFKASMQAVQASGNDASGSRAVEAIEAVNNKWRREIETLQEAHAAELEDLRKRWEERATAYKQSAAQANNEWSDVEYELGKEREAHLQTLKEYRKVNERLRKLEAEHNAATAELHAEIESKTKAIEEQNSTIEILQENGNTGGQKAEELQQRLVALEKHQSTQYADFLENYVSREQVEMMEKLFMETIEKLSARVEQLESSKGTVPNAPPRAEMNNRSRQLLEHLERGNSILPMNVKTQAGGARMLPPSYPNPQQSQKKQTTKKSW